MSETLEAPQAEAAPAPDVDAGDDLAAAIGAAYDEHASEPVEAATDEAPTRDERGRFARVGGEEAPAEPDTVEQEASTDVTQAQAQAAPEARPALPPEVAAVSSVLEEYKPLYAARGIAPDQAMRALFGAQQVLETRPYEAIQVLARQYGVDLSKFAAPPQQAAPIAQAQQLADPAYQALQQHVARLEAMITTQQQQAEQSQTAQVQRVIDEFAADPKHTHFRQVESLMTALISSGQAKGLEAAYEMACRAHPEISKAMMKTEAEAREKAAAEARRSAAAQAKTKAVSVRGSPVINGFAKVPDSIEETLAAAWDGRLN